MYIGWDIKKSRGNEVDVILLQNKQNNAPLISKYIHIQSATTNEYVSLPDKRELK